MSNAFIFENLSEPELARLAQDIAFALAPGDTLTLDGDLGAGKTTFARALIRAASNDTALEVPSPTFTLVQSYATPRFEIAHFDLYRLTDPAELRELGLDLALRCGVAMIEWPSRAGGDLPADRLTLALSETSAEDRRTATLSGHGRLAGRAARIAAFRTFLTSTAWGTPDAEVSYLQGDASPRRYARLTKPDGARAIVMDAPRQPDGPPIRDGKPYSRIAHLAEDVRPFVAIAAALRAEGFSAPEIFDHDLDAGLLLIEDFGDAVYGAVVASGRDQQALWTRAVDTLAALRRSSPNRPLPLPDGSHYTVPPLDRGALQIETELLIDWYWPAVFGTPASATARADFAAAWDTIFTRILAAPRGWMLRDYHSPNLIALDELAHPNDVGIIDFQDALAGPHAYDLVSLLQDARLDVPVATESALLNRYAALVTEQEPGFDEAQFRYLYAALGAERNTKILGIFARLAHRDGKRGYLAHIPRIWGYLARDLAHAELAPIKAWYDRHLPEDVRRRALT